MSYERGTLKVPKQKCQRLSVDKSTDIKIVAKYKGWFGEWHFILKWLERILFFDAVLSIEMKIYYLYKNFSR